MHKILISSIKSGFTLILVHDRKALQYTQNGFYIARFTHPKFTEKFIRMFSGIFEFMTGEAGKYCTVRFI